MSSFQRLVVVSLLAWGAVVMQASDRPKSVALTLAEAEETYELRLERLLQQKGRAALAAHLATELKERPRPYVKAWYANQLMYGVELGIPNVSDPVRGFALAKEAAEEGSLFAHELVGRGYADGRGTAVDLEAGVRHVREAAERGRHTAMSALGFYYFFGRGVPKDRALAEQWMRKAGWFGATAGMSDLAQWSETAKYLGALPDLKKSQALYYEVGEMGEITARKLLRERAKQGDSDAQKYVHLDMVAITIRGYDALPTQLRTAVKWLEEHSGPDETLVQLALADVMMEREWVVYNPTEARKKAERLAAAGNDDARALLAMMAWRGIGQKADPAGAVATWKELAAKGNARGLNQIGWLHWWGNGEKHGIAKDARLAYEFCKRSADLGYWAGQYNLADCYLHGIGVETNYFLAGKYYAILADRRHKRAKILKERVLGYVKD